MGFLFVSFPVIPENQHDGDIASNMPSTVNQRKMTDRLYHPVIRSPAGRWLERDRKSEEKKRQLGDMPIGCVLYIFEYLDLRSLCAVAGTCAKLQSIA